MGTPHVDEVREPMTIQLLPRIWSTSRCMARAPAIVIALAAVLLAGACTAHHRPAVAPTSSVALGWRQTGMASWYGPGYNGKRASSGEVFDQDALTAAHATLPFGTRVRVTLIATGRSVVVRINDRIPRRDRIVDLSRGAARAIGLIGVGTGRVRLEVVR
jgi:rare lipoprotein A (peptidoglycan hydrolase)